MRQFFIKSSNFGFTLIELLVVIAIIGLLASVVLVGINNARKQALDTKRLADMAQIQKALAIYYDQHNSTYPSPANNDCSGWDVGNQTLPFLAGVFTGILPQVPVDPTGTGNCTGYYYYRYPAGTSGCDPSRGAFYVLGVTRFETIPAGTSHPNSPGWQCPTRNWGAFGAGDNFQWVTGAFEK
jgi:prepilin-type N-terminal cleavage/methylation domain-containing protein